MLIVWKGASKNISLTGPEIAGCVLGVAGGVALLVVFFFLPYLWRKAVHGDWTLKWWHIAQGPLVLKRGEIPPRPEGVSEVRDYYAGHKTREEVEEGHVHEQNRQGNSDDIEKAPEVSDPDTAAPSPEIKAKQGPQVVEDQAASKRPAGPIYRPAVLFYLAKKAFFHGIDQDVVSAQKKQDFLSGNTDERNARAAHFDNRAEYMYSFLQVLTAATASFTHGANDVSKSVPLP